MSSTERKRRTHSHYRGSWCRGRDAGVAFTAVPPASKVSRSSQQQPQHRTISPRHRGERRVPGEGVDDSMAVAARGRHITTHTKPCQHEQAEVTITLIPPPGADRSNAGAGRRQQTGTLATGRVRGSHLGWCHTNRLAGWCRSEGIRSHRANGGAEVDRQPAGSSRGGASGERGESPGGLCA
jgi:hypothetical protein